MLTWFGHVERMDERRRLTKEIYEADVEGEDLGEHLLTKLGKF
jgi:hypothetical protein